MLKSVRFWMAVLLVLSAIGYTKFKKQDRPVYTATEHHETLSDAPEDTAIPVVSSGLSTEVTEASESLYFSETESGLLSEYVETAESVTEFIEENTSVLRLPEWKLNEITEKFERVSFYSEDLIGWVYLPDSEIDYPVVQGENNYYYLYHAPDKSQNQMGTIFLDYHCKKNFSDKQNILFGHNMQNGMFGDIRTFKNRDNFEQHRYGWLFTPECLYRIDFFALVIVSAYDKIYDIPTDSTEWLNAVKTYNLYDTETDVSENDCFLAFSTCASDFEDARALLIGVMNRQ